MIVTHTITMSTAASDTLLSPEKIGMKRRFATRLMAKGTATSLRTLTVQINGGFMRTPSPSHGEREIGRGKAAASLQITSLAEPLALLLTKS